MITEESILSFNKDEIRQVVEFLHERVWNGVKAATATFGSSSCNEDHTVLIRQCIARRRFDWIARILKTRVNQLMEGTKLRSRSEKQNDLKDIVLQKIDDFLWDPSFVLNSVSTAEASLQKSIISSLRWDLSEEMLFLLTKNKRTSHPLDEEMSSLSMSLMIKCLHLMANGELFNINKDVLRLKLFHMAYSASIELNHSTTANNNDISLIDKLALDTVEVAVESDKQRAGISPAEIIHQIVTVIHPIASLTDWSSSEGDTNNNSSLYSIGNLCEILI